MVGEHVLPCVVLRDAGGHNITVSARMRGFSLIDCVAHFTFG